MTSLTCPEKCPQTPIKTLYFLSKFDNCSHSVSGHTKIYQSLDLVRRHCSLRSGALWNPFKQRFLLLKFDVRSPSKIGDINILKMVTLQTLSRSMMIVSFLNLGSSKMTVIFKTLSTSRIMVYLQTLGRLNNLCLIFQRVGYFFLGMCSQSPIILILVN